MPNTEIKNSFRIQIYFSCDFPLDEITDKAQELWPGYKDEEINIHLDVEDITKCTCGSCSREYAYYLEVSIDDEYFKRMEMFS